MKKDKELLRSQILDVRNKLEAESKKTYDNWVCSELSRKISMMGYQHIHCYLPIRSEIDIRPLISALIQHEISVYVPKTLAKGKLEHYFLHSMNDLIKGLYGTYYPSDSKQYEGPFDLIIVPGAVFDKSFYRIGYGGGYYDKFLKDHPNAYTIGVAYPFQVVSKVPHEVHDIRLNEVLVNELLIMKHQY